MEKRKVTLSILKKELKNLVKTEGRIITIRKKLAYIIVELASVNFSKKNIQETITAELRAGGMAESYIKRVRGFLMGFYAGVSKHPEIKEDVLKSLDNIETNSQLETLGKNVKKGEVTIVAEPKKEENKEKEDDVLKLIKKYIKIGKKSLSKEQIDLLLEEIKMIQKILQGDF